MIECPNCNATNRDAAKFCSFCGYGLKRLERILPQKKTDHGDITGRRNLDSSVNVQPAIMGINCPKCSSVNRDTAKFCAGCGINLISFRSLPKGTIIGSYVIEERIGVGGIGTVYRSRHRVLEHLVAAIKIHDYFPEDEQVGIAFKESANYLSQMSHSNIVQLIDYGFQGSHAYLAMEYIKGGRNISSMIPDQPGEDWLDQCFVYIDQLLKALQYAHTCRYLDLVGRPQRGIIHGDIKPQNILLDPKTGTAKLTDFMIPDVQNFLDQENKKFDRAQTDAFGTPMYMAPEQNRGVLNEQNDIYSLGATMYQFVTGNLPINARHQSPKSVNPYLPDWLEQMIMKCMEFYPSDRFKTVSDMIIIFNKNRKSGKVSRVYNKKEVYNLGDTYNVDQAGAVGPGSHAHDMVFTKITTQSGDTIDLPSLAKELSMLRSKMKEKAVEPEQDVAVGAIAEAETEAKNGHAPKVLESLAKAGKWALDVATQIGVPVAIAAIKASLGMP